MSPCSRCGQTHDAAAPCDADTRPPPPTLAGGQRVDRYEILAVLGVGAFGAVYRARHVHTEQHVALKVLRSEARAQPGAVEALMREARAAATIGHPNIVRVLDGGVSERGEPFLVMELVDGRDLRRMLEDEGPLAPERAVDIARQVLAGLEAAHARGIVHRDVKPANIFVTPVFEAGTWREHARLLDFGISKVRGGVGVGTGAAGGYTLPGTAIGTPGYMAPEQFVSAGDADGRADLYAVAATLCEMLSGNTPFGDASYATLLRRVHCERPPPLSSLAPHLPPRLGAVVDRGLSRDPDGRWATAADFSAALGDALSSADPAVRESQRWAPRTAPLREVMPAVAQQVAPGSWGPAPYSSPPSSAPEWNPPSSSPSVRAPGWNPQALPMAHGFTPLPASHPQHASQTSHASHAPHAPHGGSYPGAPSSVPMVAQPERRALPFVLAAAGGVVITLLVGGAFYLGQENALSDDGPAVTAAPAPGFVPMAPTAGASSAMPAPPAPPPTAPAPVPAPAAADPGDETPTEDSAQPEGAPSYPIATAQGVTVSDLHVVGEVDTAAARAVAARAVHSMGECRVASRRETVRAQIFLHQGRVTMAHPMASAPGNRSTAQCVADRFREAARTSSNLGDGIMDFRADLTPR